MGVLKYKNKDEFITVAEEVHKNEYDYSKTDYIDTNHKIKIICSKHGEFSQRPSDHLGGCGCPECKKEKVGNSHRMSKQSFIEKCRKVHGDRYIYDKVEYKNMKTKVLIGCKIHGYFEQEAWSHSRGINCPDCGRILSNKSSKAKLMSKPTMLYYAKINNLWKIGVTNGTIESRYRDDIKAGVKVELIYSKMYPNRMEALAEEERIIIAGAPLKYRGPRFMISGGETEMFYEDIRKNKE